MQQRPRVVVVGAGFGGLAAAIRLQARGFQVSLLDKRDQAGGRAYVYRDQGFTFDGGPTVVTAPFLFDELFELAGKRREDYVTFVRVDPFYRVRFDDGSFFDYNGDVAHMAREIARFSPEDVAGYHRFLEDAKAIYEVGFEQLGDLPFSKATDMLRIAPKMVKLKSYQTVYQYISSYVKHPKIRTVLSFHPLLVGGNPFATTSIYALIAHLERNFGVWYAMGGTGAIVEALLKLFGELGGELVLSAEADEILVEGGRASGVRTKDGRTFPADYVVSNADAPYTYKKLLPAKHRRKHTDAKVDKMAYSMSLVVIYFGTRRQYPELKHHSILLGPRYRELLEDIFNKKVLADDFSLYLHAPTRTDPAMAPEGGECFYVLAPVPHLDAKVNWEELRERYADKVMAHLEATVLPGLSEALVTRRVIDPIHFKEVLNSERGAAFSIEPRLTQSAYFRFHNQSEELPNLFLVGAGTHPGAGMPGVLCTAKVVDRLVPQVPGTGNPRDPIAGTHAR